MKKNPLKTAKKLPAHNIKASAFCAVFFLIACIASISAFVGTSQAAVSAILRVSAVYNTPSNPTTNLIASLGAPVFAETESNQAESETETGSNQAEASEADTESEFFILPVPNLFSKNYILVLRDSDQVLYEKNADEKVYPASTTKIMTALIVLENIENLDEVIAVDAESPFVDGSKIFLDVAEEISIRDLLNAMLIASGNDAASALAIRVSGSTEEFAKLMNQKAEALGCKQTHFVNPHGLHDEEHYTTARDLYLIARAAMDYPVFREIVGTAEYTIAPTNKQPETRYLYNTNALIEGGTGSYELIEDIYGDTVQTMYEYATGIKTGYTDEAGLCLVSSAADKRHTVFAVVMNSDERRFEDSRKLLEYGLFGFQSIDVLKAGDFVTKIDLDDAQETVVQLVAMSNLTSMLVDAPKAGEVEFKTTLDQKLTLPIRSGEKLGTVSAYLNGVHIGSVGIASNADFFGRDLLDDVVTVPERPFKIDIFGIVFRVIAVFVVFVIVTLTAYFVGLHPNSPNRKR